VFGFNLLCFAKNQKTKQYFGTKALAFDTQKLQLLSLRKRTPGEAENKLQLTQQTFW
jgi:hypothetical protein